MVPLPGTCMVGQRMFGTVRKATAADVPQLAMVLARAFSDDPPSRWFFPDSRVRQRRLRAWFELALQRLYLRHDECYTTDDRAGAALWVPPGVQHMGVAEQIALLPRAVALFGRD